MIATLATDRKPKKITVQQKPALEEQSFRRRHLRRVRSLGGFGETHGSKAHAYERASGLADLSWQAQARRKHLSVHACWVVVGV